MFLNLVSLLWTKHFIDYVVNYTHIWSFKLYKNKNKESQSVGFSISVFSFTELEDDNDLESLTMTLVLWISFQFCNLALPLDSFIYILQNLHFALLQGTFTQSTLCSWLCLIFSQSIDEAMFFQYFESRCRGRGNCPIRDGAEFGVVNLQMKRKRKCCL